MGQLLLYSLISPLFNNHSVSLLILIGLHFVIVTLFVGRFNKKIRLILYSSFISRFLIMLIDIYMKGIINIPHSGADTEKFYSWALSLSGSLSDIISSSHELYVKMIAIVFTIVTEERIIIQYINVLLGFTVVYLVYLILSMLKINKNNILIGTSIAAFFPHSLIFSGIMLREMLSTIFVIAGVYYLVKWYMKMKKIDFFLSIIMILISSLFHSGVIGFLIAHVFITLFYNNTDNNFNFTSKTILYFIVLVLFLGWFFGVYDWNNLSIFRKLNISNIEEVYDSTANSAGGSAYLTSLSITNIFEMILYAPLYILFFISSPLPFDWRSISDIISFFMDGIIYLSMSIYILKNINLEDKKDKYLAIILSIGLIGTLFIFGIGVQNSGTAMRHRQKIFPVFVIIITMIKNCKDNFRKISI